MDQNPTTSLYLTAVQKHPSLSREEETELFHRWREDRDVWAHDTLVCANLRHVVAIALRYRHYELPIDELIAEGNLGIFHALMKFAPERGNRFITYAAYWVRAFILNYIVCSWSLVGAGSGALRTKMFFKLRRERARIINLLGEGELAQDMLAERLNVSRPRLAQMVGQLDARDVSLHCRVFNDSATTLLDTLVSSDKTPEDVCAHDQSSDRMSRVARTALKALDERERYVVEHRLMADSEEEQSLAALGRRLGVSRERARQLEARAIRKLRQRIVELSGSASLEGLTADTAA